MHKKPWVSLPWQLLPQPKPGSWSICHPCSAFCTRRNLRYTLGSKLPALSSRDQIPFWVSLQPPAFSFAVIKSRHTIVTVIFLPPYRVVPTLTLEPECRPSLFLESVQSEVSQRNSDFHLANPLRILWRRVVIAPHGSPMRTW